jgi:hypothetical protein
MISLGITERRDLCVRRKYYLIISLALFLSSTVAALASEDVQQRPMISTTLSLMQIDDSKIDSTDASFGYTESSVGLDAQLVFLNVDYREYDWKDSSSFGGRPGIDPWKTLTRIAPGLQYFKKFNEKWAVWPKVAAIAGFEDEISSDSWTYNPQVVGLYMYTKQMTIYGGLGMLYHPIESVVYPVLGVAWNMDSKDGISGAVGFPETMLRYGFSEKLALKMDFQWDIRYYRLADDNDLASGGYVKIEDLIPGLQIEYEALKGLTFRLGVRRYLGRKLTVFNSKENELTSNDVSDSSAYLLGVGYKF